MHLLSKRTQTGALSLKPDTMVMLDVTVSVLDVNKSTPYVGSSKQLQSTGVTRLKRESRSRVICDPWRLYPGEPPP